MKFGSGNFTDVRVWFGTLVLLVEIQCGHTQALRQRGPQVALGRVRLIYRNQEVAIHFLVLLPTAQ